MTTAASSATRWTTKLTAPVSSRSKSAAPGFGHKTLRIKADSAADAEAKALDEAGNHSYNEKDSDYSVQGVTRLDDDKAPNEATVAQGSSPTRCDRTC